MSVRPDIAVVLPCYKPTTEELRWTLDSLRSQTVPFRVFVVDDGSPVKPDYAALLAGLDHELILLPENRGVCTVRNPALERALAEGFSYIAIIDCGDWCHPDRLAKQMAFFEAHPGIAVLGGASSSLNEAHELLFTFRAPLDPDDVVRYAFYGLPFRHPAMMFRAGVFREIGFYSDEFDAAEDYELVRRALLRFRMANLPDVVVDKVLAANSVSTLRRRSQLWSRLRIQWHYRALGNPHFWLGLGKTLLVMMTPTPIVQVLKPLVYGKHDNGRPPPMPAPAGEL